MNTHSFTCPIDGLPLEDTASGCKCTQGHQFDRSRHGYLNLLPVQYKSSKDPGDSKSMVAARRAVMNLGVFDSLSCQVTRNIAPWLDAMESPTGTGVDAGCGEGYFTQQLQQGLSSQRANGRFQMLGVDISKWAITAAAKKYRDITWAVATNKHLPVETGKVELITSFFGFETWRPWSKIQIPGQLVLVLDAGPDHLLELREMIYPKVNKHAPPDNVDAADAGYTLLACEDLKYQVMASSNTLQGFLEMTPHGKRITNERLEAIKLVSDCMLTINGVLRIYQR